MVRPLNLSNTMPRDEAFVVAAKLKEKLSGESPDYESLKKNEEVLVVQDERGECAVIVGPNRRTETTTRPRATEVVKNWPESWTKDYQVGDPVQVHVWESGEDWTSPRTWMLGIITSINSFTGCVEVQSGAAKYYATGPSFIRHLQKPKCVAAAAPDQTAKQDAGKVDWGLLFPHVRKALEAVIAVRAYGATKYGDSESWTTVDPARYKKAAMRHLIESMCGGKINKADGNCRHLAQGICDLLFALELELKEEEENKK